VRSSRLAALILLGGAVAAGLTIDAADEDASTGDGGGPLIEAGVAMPAANPADTLSSTWYCAAGSATEDGLADHVVLILNPTDADRRAAVTALRGTIAPRPVAVAEDAGGDTTTTTVPPESTTTTVIEPPPAATAVEVPAHSLVRVALRDLVDAPLAGAVVEVDGGEVSVEHEITGEGGRATAPCSTTAAAEWSFPWGVTQRGSRELLVFMNPFPDDATIDVELATDEGPRESLRFQGFVVPGRSVVGAFVEQDTRRAHVSAHVHVGSGRVVVDRIQTFDGTDGVREGLTLGLGAPTAAETWMFPDGEVGSGRSEQIVVFNPTDEVAEVEVEVRLDDPESNEVPEPYELTIPPSGFSIVGLDQPDEGAPEGAPRRVPDDVPFSVFVRSLNQVPVTAERVTTLQEPSRTLGIGATLGSPLAAPTWFFPGGGATEERHERLIVLNADDEQAVTFSVTAYLDGEQVPIEGLQDLEVPAGGRRAVRLRDHIEAREAVPTVVVADGPVVVERWLARLDGRGLSQSMGIPLDEDVLVPDPLGG